jgi:hypothetical protein
MRTGTKRMPLSIYTDTNLKFINSEDKNIVSNAGTFSKIDNFQTAPTPKSI